MFYVKRSSQHGPKHSPYVDLPPSSISVTHSPNIEMEDIMTIINLGTITRFIPATILLTYLTRCMNCSKNLTARRPPIVYVHTVTKPTTPLTEMTESSMKRFSCLPLPYELYERKISIQGFHTAISNLPDKQGKTCLCPFHSRHEPGGYCKGRRCQQNGSMLFH